jgi:hypothetical protein
MQRERWTGVRWVPIAAAAVGLFVAGCGGKSPTQTHESAKQFVNHALTQGVQYAQCMRTHGVPSFSDPHVTSSAQGVGVSQGVSAQTAGSPAFNSAQQACRKLLPAGAQGPSNQPVSASQQAEMVKFAACVRHHGVPNMPDPAANGVFNLPDTINQQAPAFESAIKRCLPNGMPLALNQGP